MKNLEEIRKFSEGIRTKSSYRDPLAFALGRVHKSDRFETLSVNYAHVNYKESFLIASVIFWALEENGIKVDFSKSEFVTPLSQAVVKSVIDIFDCLYDEVDKHPNLKALIEIDRAFDNESEFTFSCIFEDEKPLTIESVYLKLYLMSLEKVPARSLNLDGAIEILPNIAWDEIGFPYEIRYLKENEITLKMHGLYPNIVSVDKLPRFLSHIVPDENTRILDGSNLSLGATQNKQTALKDFK